MATAVVVTESLEPISCGECGIWFAFPESIVERRRRDGRTFYCPNGHPRAWFETEAQKLRKRLEWQEAETARERAARFEAETAARKANQKLRRVERGTCPECRRHFVNVERHMKTKHASARPSGGA